MAKEKVKESGVETHLVEVKAKGEEKGFEAIYEAALEKFNPEYAQERKEVFKEVKELTEKFDLTLKDLKPLMTDYQAKYPPASENPHNQKLAELGNLLEELKKEPRLKLVCRGTELSAQRLRRRGKSSQKEALQVTLLFLSESIGRESPDSTGPQHNTYLKEDGSEGMLSEIINDILSSPQTQRVLVDNKGLNESFQEAYTRLLSLEKDMKKEDMKSENPMNELEKTLEGMRTLSKRNESSSEELKQLTADAFENAILNLPVHLRSGGADEGISEHSSNVLKEMLKTEQAFGENIKVLIDKDYELSDGKEGTIIDYLEDKGHLTSEEKDLLTDGLDDAYAVIQDMESKLKAVDESDNDKMKNLVNAYSNFGDYADKLEGFIINSTKITEVLGKIKTRKNDKAVNKFFKKNNRKYLNSNFITFVQRLPRHRMLLDDFLKKYKDENKNTIELRKQMDKNLVVVKEKLDYMNTRVLQK